MELVLIIIIVALAGGYWARSTIKAMKPKPTDSGCECGCSGCSGSVGNKARPDLPDACNPPVTSK